MKVRDLHLDPNNPRLPLDIADADEPALIALMARDYSLLELGQSLADNGYFAEEPLAVIRDTSSQRKIRYTVIEGNRRLASLKLLTDANLREQLHLSDWNVLADSCNFDLTSVPCIVYGQREDLINFMGFRHITGVKPWEPLAKGRFINTLIEGHGLDFREAARRIGSKPSAVRLHYLVHRVYIQARDQFGLDVSGVENDYGVFTRALSSGPLREYIGLSGTQDGAREARRLQNPISSSKMARLRDLISWVSGVDGTPSVIGESRDITALGEVVANPGALELLRSSRSLSVARQVVAGEEIRLIEHLNKAAYHLDEALKDVHRHRKSKKVVQVVQRCDEAMTALHQLMTK